MAEWMRHGMGAVRPYLYGNLAVIDFITETFGAEVLEKLENLGASPGFHVEFRIADAALVLEASDAWSRQVPTQSAYVYVPDVDDAFIRAIAMGGTPMAEPEDKPYQERACGVRDPFGNVWYIATYTG